MTDAQMIFLISIIGFPLIGGMAFIIKMILSIRKDILDSVKESNKNFEEIRRDLRGLEARISHVEGFLIGRGQKIGG